MRHILSLVVVSALVVGCNPDLPSLDYHGERVSVGSNMVDQVCGGTLTRLDREVEQIEARLDLPRHGARLDVYIVDHATVDAHCPGANNCAITPPRGAAFVVVDQQKFEWAIAHELVHARLAGITSVPLFSEGIAEATSPPSCRRKRPDVELSELLAAKTGMDFLAVRGSYYVAEELVAWLLGEFGPGEVLSLMRSAERGSSPATIRAKYLEHFDRKLDDDLLAHVRTGDDLDALPPEHFGCFAAPLDASNGSVRLVADLDCDSDRVHNHFGVDGSGYVEWTLHVDHGQTLELAGDIPFGTSLTLEECGCIPRRGEDEYRLARPFRARERLQPGSYRLRWTGDLDEGLALDVGIVRLQD